jgi:hypothetical protein
MKQDRGNNAITVKPEIMKGRKLNGTEAELFYGFHDDPGT